MKKALAILLACVMVFLAVPFATFIVVAADEPKEAIGTGDALWDGSTVDSSWFSAETYAEQTEFHLTSAAQVASLKSVVTTTYTFEGKTIYLDCDVYLNNVTSIASDTVFTRATNHNWSGYMIENFKGTFDGQGNSIYGLYVYNNANNTPAGFFRAFGGNAPTVRNLSLKYCDVKSEKDAAGAIVGQIGKAAAKIENCHVIGVITSGGRFAGGIGGSHKTEYNWRGTVSGCSVRGSVSCTSADSLASAGGIVPIIKMTSSSNSATIRDCYVYADVSAGGAAGAAGGIVGRTTNSNKSKLNVRNCGVSGTVKGGAACGGIVGEVTLSTTANFEGCYSVAKLQATDAATTAVGGVIGKLIPGSSGALSLANTYYMLHEGSLASAQVGVNTGTYDYAKKATEITLEEATARATGSLLVRLNEYVAANAGCIDWHIGHHGFPVHTTLRGDDGYISQFEDLENVVTVGTLRGAQIKLTDKNETVLRFTAAVKDTYVEKLTLDHTVEGEAPTVEFGTLLIPTADLEAYQLTPSASYLLENALVNYPTFVYTVATAKADEETQTHYWYADTAAQQASDLTVRYSALSFARVTDKTGEKTYYDAPFDTQHNTRSSLGIAEMAYADRDTAGETVYSEAKFAVLKAYLDNSVAVAATDGGVEIVTDHGEYYANPYTVERNADGTLVLSAAHLTASSKIHLTVNGVYYTNQGAYSNADFVYESGKVTVTLRPSQSGVASIKLDPVRVVAWQDFGLDLTIANKITRTDESLTDTPTLIWSSSNTDVATVDENGSLTLKAPGTTYVVATTPDGVVSNTVTVVVTPAQNRAEDQQLSLPATSTNRIDVAKHLALPTGGYGAAQIAMWKNDARGAFSITIDDSFEWEFEAWNYASQRNDLPVTFIVPANLAGTDGAFWKQQVDAGQDVQSHSYSHSTNTAMVTWSTAQIWMDYYNSVEPIFAATGQSVETIGYSYGYGLAEYAGKLFISGRGTHGEPNYGGKIKYQSINSCSSGFNSNIWGWMQRIRNTFDPTNQFYGGWTNYHFHQVNVTEYTEADGTVITNEKEWLDYWFSHYLQPLRDDRSLWADTYRNVAKYGQERDTATLTVESVSDTAITVSIHDMMDDTVFNQALTVKIMVDATWTGVTATQNGEACFAEIVTNEQGTFVFVDVVPDAGSVTVTAVK